MTIMTIEPARRIVLTGTYNSFNKGDAAMEIMAVRRHTKRYARSYPNE